MNIVVVNGSIVGSNTKAVMEQLVVKFERLENAKVSFINLADYELQFSDGRNYIDYEGDTKFVTETLMKADGIVIGTPIFQASIPGSLKNLFDLLPVDAFRNKVLSIVVTAGSSKHYLVAEQQLKPILSYMKGQVVPSYVFIREVDILRQKIINDDVVFRLDRLVEDTITLIEVYQDIQKKKEDQYDF